jgi:NAD(P)-dependent dehydrogenase (short-subunit alcohol dehydrogenase family)
MSRKPTPSCAVMSSASPRSTADGAAELLRQLPDVDILVNNLGIFGAVPVREITNEQWRTYFEVNVLAAARLIRMYLPEMTERGWGRAIQIASDSALVIPEEMIHYGAPKTALLALACGFAKDAAGTGITVNSVMPGRHTPQASRTSCISSWKGTTSRCHGTRPSARSCASTGRNRQHGHIFGFAARLDSIVP